jgi:hypothetical protein
MADVVNTRDASGTSVRGSAYRIADLAEAPTLFELCPFIFCQSVNGSKF